MKKESTVLKRFNVLNSENDQNVEGIDYPVLLNVVQIVSIKSINIMFKENIIQGFWIRMVNGKKYKATRIPKDLKLLLESETELTEVEINGTSYSGSPNQNDLSSLSFQ